MEQPNKPTPKGRSGLILALLRQAQKTRPGEEASASPAEPPKPRGRAALMQKLAAMSTKGVGEEPSTSAIVPKVEQVVEVTKKLESTTLEAEATTDKPAYYRGSSGKPVPVTANYIRLKVDRDMGVFAYDVKFDPPVDSKIFRRKLLNSNLSKMGNIRMFDEGAQLYLPIKLPDHVTSFSCKHPQTEEQVTMTVTFIKQKRLGDCLVLYNVLFKRVMHALLYSRIGRNYFSPEHSDKIPQHKLEILPGYVVAVDEFEGGVMLCLDVQHRVLRMQNVLDLLREYRITFKQNFKEMAFNNIIGACVLTRYNNKNYTIDEIMWDCSPKDTFKTHDGSEISYIEYYKKQYNIDIRDTNQPLLLNKQSVRQVGTLEKVDRFICLVPELCFMTGLTDEMRSDFKVMKDVAQFTRVTPNQRMNSLRKFLENVSKSEDAQKILKDWGLELDSATIDLQMRVLEQELIVFGEGVPYKGKPNAAEWNSAIMKNKLLGPIDFLSWIIIYTERDSRVAKDFAENIKRIAPVMGCRINQPTMQALQDDRTETYVKACRSVKTREVQMLVFICPTLRSDRYSAIKKICCAEMAIPSQVILSRTLQNQSKVHAITQKIALQMNCKLGGSLWSVRFPFKNWMIVGIDVYHSKGNKSVCALVASMNESITAWYNQAVYQEQEIGDHLKYMFIKALEKYRDLNGVFPKKIVFFRDGVGDGQLEHCRRYEIPQIETCIKEFNISDCSICFVVVQKRINTRMFMKTANGLENPYPGSVLDHSVTRRNLYDFFLVAQHVGQGTVTPTHYIVLHDTSNMNPEHMQKLSFKLCHLYYNWPGTIRVPAPCQYAHKLAYLVGQYIGKMPASSLLDKLFYL